ncbi:MULTISPECIES: PilZ domain-containing protein [unclassified Nocardioides]|uniref:PilZ domain-containing protein n=1 Tax=unclassified Nocardioides TaxID=2615069 RepID=UPI00059FA514|nr:MULTISPECIES: PilZ domain-containing protein [unclassified Nocardioides]
MALIVNLAAIGLGALIQQAMLRRLRRGNHARREGQRELISPAEVEDQGADSQEVASDHDAEPDHEMGQDLDHDPDERGDDESTAPIDHDDAVPTARTRRTPVAPTTVPLADPADRIDNAPVTAGAVRVAARRDTAAAADTRPGTSGSSTYEPGDLDTLSAASVVYDRRERLRVPYQGRARLQWAGHDLACETINLDINGVRCTLPAQGEAAPAPGTPARITLMLDGVLLPTAARVTSSASEGNQWRIGLRFEPLEDHYRETLLTFLHEQHRMN